MKYFAYGSNMLLAWLRTRVPGARVIGHAYVTGRKLEFHKASRDGSGKCSILQTTNLSDVVHGVLFEIPSEQMAALDRAEGAGYGYERTSIDITFDDKVVSAVVYVAKSKYVDYRLQPYDWYHELVLAGAQENHLPADYICGLSKITARPDADPTSKTRLRALGVLKGEASPL